MVAKDYNVEERYALAMLGKRIMVEGRDIQERLNALAATFGVSSMSIRRWIKKLDEKGSGGLQRRGRSDCGFSRSTCIWAIKRARRLEKSKKAHYSFNKITQVLNVEASQAGPQFCTECRYRDSCSMSGRGIKVGSRHAIARILNCATSPKSSNSRRSV